jgi:hypothetical protein
MAEHKSQTIQNVNIYQSFRLYLFVKKCHCIIQVHFDMFILHTGQFARPCVNSDKLIQNVLIDI